MKNISKRDEKEGIYLFVGRILRESDIDPLWRILNRLLEKIAKLERNGLRPERTRSNELEYSHDTLSKAQKEQKRILEETRVKVAVMSRRLDHDRAARTKLYKEIDEQEEVIVLMGEAVFHEVEARIKQDKRISDIEEFQGDI